MLLGANDTGTWSFHRALRVLNGVAAWTTGDAWRVDAQARATLVGWVGQTVRVESANGRTTGTPYRTAHYTLPAEGPALESPGYSDSAGAPPCQDLPREVPALFDYLLRRDRDRFFEAEKTIRTLAPGFERIDVATPTSETRRIGLTVDRGFLVAPAAMSTGARLLMLFIALAHHPAAPELILIEEPENGIHPQRLKDVIGILRRISEGGRSGVHGRINCAEGALAGLRLRSRLQFIPPTLRTEEYLFPYT